MRSFFTSIIIILGLYIISHNHLINNEFNLPAYLIGLIILLCSLLLYLKYFKTINVHLALYLLVTITSQIIYMIRSGIIQAGLLEAIIIYIIVPSVFYGIYKIMLRKPDIALHILKFVSFMSVFSFAGSILYILSHLNLSNLFPETFKLEITQTGESIQIKNTSFYGNSLTVGGLALVQAMASIYLYIKTNKNIFLFFILFAVLVCMLSLARRAMVPLCLLLIIFQFYLPHKQKVISSAVFLTLFLFGIILFNEEFSSIMERLISSFNLTDATSGNETRIRFMKKGVEIIATEPFGVGLANLSSLGKGWKDLVYGAPVGFLTVVESGYLVFVGEIGIIGCFILLPSFIIFLKSLSKYSIYLVILPIGLETVMGLSIYSLLILSLLLCILASIEAIENCNFKLNNSRKNTYQ